MPVQAWYQHKAELCSRLAKEATDARVRARYEEEERLWRQIAADDKNERNRFGSDPV
jgi:hypothetical protein